MFPGTRPGPLYTAAVRRYPHLVLSSPHSRPLAPTLVRCAAFAGLLAVVAGLFASCAGLDPRSLSLPPVLPVSEPDGLRLGSLVEAQQIFLEPSATYRSTLSLATLPLLRAVTETELLEEWDYPAFREAAFDRLSDAQGLRIVFVSADERGNPRLESGLLMLPAARADMRRDISWVVYTKGTEMEREIAPSANRGAEKNLLAMMASLGYAVWMPDYDGFGVSTSTHSYCVPDALARSALAGLIAARSYVSRSAAGAYEETGSLYLAGYSEGGLGAMAATRAFVEDRYDLPGLDLVASYPMSAPLNLMSVLDEGDLGLIELDSPQYTLNLVLGWASAYPERIDPRQMLRPIILEEVVPLYDGTRDGGELHRAIAEAAGTEVGSVTNADLFREDYLRRLEADPSSVAYYQAQIEARLDHWEAPVGLALKLLATPADSLVPFENSLTAYLWNLGRVVDNSVSLVHLTGSDHSRAAGEAILFAFVDIERFEGRHP